ncbi:Prolyl tripeptidyl peptidase precursor [Gemmata sp. SH-PL17]|uniref:alpha/beta hydrolase family protein n=1 Tax=Gemmata sp. SH-PL17 TaxID=1630693 RepID=UPI00078EA105|nr:prolyl oligopeptidase family serine peptidase [Gemmata sp. SH-PL17]AMV29101.1 Prolyl tripeptidyl peptidase precursor [Gemmata sp. SH-PL17]
MLRARLASRGFAAIALFGLIVASAGPLSAQPANKKVLTFAEYDIWRAASSVTLSRDGQFVAYLVGAENADGEAVVRHVSTGREYRFPRGVASGTPVLGTSSRFTPNGKKVLLPLTPTKAALDKAKSDKLKTDEYPKATIAIIDLASGKELDRITGSGSFQIGGEGDGFLIYRKPTTPEPGKTEAKEPITPPAKGKGKGPLPAPGGATAGPSRTYGSDLFIRDLSGTTDRTITEVSEYSLSADEQTLVYTVSSRKDEKNGVYTLNPKFGTGGSPLKVGPGRYTNLIWDEKQTKLAFFFDDSQIPSAALAPPPHPAGSSVGTPITTTPSTPTPPRYRVFVWDRAAKTEPKPITRLPLGAIGGFGAITATAVATHAPAPAALNEVLGPDTPGIKKGWTISGNTLSFSQDGTKLYVATAPERAPQPTTPPTDDIQLDIWHWKDANIQPMQKLRAAQDRNRTFGAVMLLDTKQFRQLSDDEVTVQQAAVGDWAMSTDDRKYKHTTGYAFPVANDYALVNVRSGAKLPVATASTANFALAPNGKYLLSFNGKDWSTVSVPDGKKVNLTEKLAVKFFDEEHDSPSDPPPYGAAQWTSDGKFVLLSDRYDIWKIAADGSGAENLTKVGRTQGLRFTLLRPRSPDDRSPLERTVDLSKPHLLGTENLRTYDTGFYRLEPGAEPRLLLMGGRSYGNPIKAKDADVYLLTVQTFSQYPDYYVTSPDFNELTRVTDINPHVKNYNWGRAEQVRYTSTDGAPLTGILVKPENFDPSKKYPMVVYIYERLSENLHQFRVPNVTRGQVVNPTFYASNGYLVLMPDIAYKIGYPGPSAIKCVLPAIQAVVDKGFVDEKAIGINGQSWGGYQIAYMVTQTNRFKAAVAGAPVSNMVSAYDGIRWGTGLPRQFQYEKTQSRIGATLWETPMRYIENSPVFMADRVQTPLLMIHNDQDDAVPWYQGIEYFLALRRLGKEAYLLNYNGEPHNLAKKPAARDFAMRMFQFFEHHLKNKPAPEWMEKGVPYIDREKEKEQWRKQYGLRDDRYER